MDFIFELSLLNIDLDIVSYRLKGTYSNIKF